MWIEELKNGKFRAVERYKDPITGKQKKVSVTISKNTAATRKAAEQTLAVKINRIIMTSRDNNDKLTFSQLVEFWREYQKKTVKLSTYKRNFHSSKVLMQIIGEDALVNKLSAGYVMNKLMQHDKKPGTINEHLARFKTIIRWGYKFDYVNDINWLVKLEPQKNEEKKIKLADKYLESDELKKLLEGMEIERWRNLTQLLALTGLRVGEAFALKIDDIDLTNRQIHVTKTFDVVNDIFTTPKTETSVRDVFITDELLGLCKSLRSDALARKLANKNEMIFYERRHDYYAYEKYFKNATKSIVGRELTVHALRHTHVSLLAEHGVTLDVIARRLGHNNSKVTKAVYFHVTEKLKKSENDLLNAINLL